MITTCNFLHKHFHSLNEQKSILSTYAEQRQQQKSTQLSIIDYYSCELDHLKIKEKIKDWELTSQKGLAVTTLYVAGSRSTRHISVKQSVRRTVSGWRTEIFCTVNSAYEVSASSVLKDLHHVERITYKCT